MVFGDNCPDGGGEGGEEGEEEEEQVGHTYFHFLLLVFFSIISIMRQIFISSFQRPITVSVCFNHYLVINQYIAMVDQVQFRFSQRKDHRIFMQMAFDFWVSGFRVG